MTIRDLDGEFVDPHELMGATLESEDPDFDLRDTAVLSQLGMHLEGRGGGGSIRLKFRNTRRELPFDDEALTAECAEAGLAHSMSAPPSMTPGFMVSTSPPERFRTPYKEIIEESKGF